MSTILFHSSKTMRLPPAPQATYQQPRFLSEAQELMQYLVTLTPAELMKTMHISEKLARSTHQQIAEWTSDPASQRPAIDTFIGDMYSGLRANTFTPAERRYANDHLVILSGLYGALRALDSVSSYRLEMGYRLPGARHASLYDFWGDSLAASIASDGLIVNLSSAEYTRAILPYVDPARVVTPTFLTLRPGATTPTFVAVHAKIARGAFARWLITSQVSTVPRLSEFRALGYQFDEGLSGQREPVFVCRNFKGLGLSIRKS